MFSPPPPSSKDPNARIRKRVPTSRPTSRTQSHSERDGSVPARGTFKSDSSISFRQDSASTNEGDLSVVRKSAAPTTAKGADDGVVDWTLNEKYRVAKLPGLPPALKSCATYGHRAIATADSTHRYALILTHTAAYVWNYTSTHGIPHTYSFPLPKEEGYESPNQPFPLGTLVSPSANSNEPGLVVVMPMSGRVAYWDAVGSAVAEGLFSKKRGVEGRVTIMSSESVTAICSIEPAGFILSLSSGRLAHLALRDQAGRPGVNVTIMRGYGGMIGGLFGALRAGSSRRDVVAVRAGKVVRMGEREVVVATVRGNFSRWQVSRSGTYANIAEFDAREDMLVAAESFDRRAIASRNRDQFVIVDVEVGGYTPSADSDEEDMLVLVLAAYMPTNEGQITLYVLATVHFLSGGRASTGIVHIVKAYTEPMEQVSRPRLYLPLPGETAFVVFPRAVVIVSLTKPQIDPDMDPDEYERIAVFEDVVDFRGDLNVEIIGSGSENAVIERQSSSQMTTSFGSFASEQGHAKKTRNPAVVLIAKGAGVVRVEAFDDADPKKRIPRAPPSAKSKIEQAVFFSHKEGNPINFRGRDEIAYPPGDIERAALEISREILSSTSSYIPALLPALESHLALRAKYLRNLVEHVTSTFLPLSRAAMWQLLSDAEKCEAARTIWATRDARIAEDSKNADDSKKSEGVLEGIIAQLTPDGKDLQGQDPVRLWFLREVTHIDDLLPLAKKSLVAQSNKGKRDQVDFAKADAEANAIIIGALMTAWDFRVTNARLYHLKDEIDENGLLREAGGLPSPWTSESDILQSLNDQYEVSQAVLKTLYMHVDQERQDLMERITDNLLSLAEICCRGFEERIRWCNQQLEDAALQNGLKVQERYLATRGSWIKPLVEIDRTDIAYETAEKWHDYRTLVEVASSQLAQTEIALAEAEARKAEEETINALRDQKDDIEQRIETYFATFGEGFANEMYDYMVENQHLQTLLNGFVNWREQYLTSFLRSSSKYAKLSWIHDVSLGDYNRAGTTLLQVATELEPALWNRQAELSIGKLAKLAAGVEAVDIEAFDIHLALTKIQDTVFEAVSNIRKQAIDTEAAVQLGLDELGRAYKRHKPGHRELFKRSFRQLINGAALDVEELIDLLTMMESDEGSMLNEQEFFLALKALGMAGLPAERGEVAERTIWRRCYLRDDWATLTQTRHQTDATVSSAVYHTALFTTMRLCHVHGLFTVPSPFAPRAPEQCSFSEDPCELRARFPWSDEDSLTQLAHELLDENHCLAVLIAKASLHTWFDAVWTDVREGVAAADVEEEVMTEGGREEEEEEEEEEDEMEGMGAMGEMSEMEEMEEGDDTVVQDTTLHDESDGYPGEQSTLQEYDDDDEIVIRGDDDDLEVGDVEMS